MVPVLRRDVRVCLCGDEGVGKSSIITSLLKESFVPLPPQTVLPEVSIPSEGAEKGLTTYLVDTSPRRDDRAHLELELRRAQVVALVYSIDDPQSFDRLAEYWLPMIRQLGVNIPVVLVGNKLDLRQGDVTNEALEEEILPIMTEFKEVETCVECSAKACLNIAEVFYFAQRAVLYPTAPLYDSREHVLKPACLQALQRIFRLSDADKDDVLDDRELNAFQLRCFNAPLQQSELDGIKEVIRRHNPAFVSAEGGVTESGFVLLHTLFVQQGRLETSWIMLRAFGYGEDLALKQSFLEPRFDVPSGCSVELSPSGYAFFTDLFERHDKDRDGALRVQELDALFAVSPGNPWLAQGFPDTTVTDDFGAVTLQGWLAQWSMTTLLDHRTTLAYLAYLGYGSPESGTISALTLGPPRQSRPSGKNKRERNVLCAYVLGAAGSGKTALLSRFVGKPLSRNAPYKPTEGTKQVVNSVEIRGGAEKYLVLLEFGRYEAEALRSAKKLAQADLVIFVYDSSDTNSFTHVSNLRQQYKLLDGVPTLFVATKSDLDRIMQRHEVQPEEYARRLFVRAPISVNGQADLTELFRTLAEAALAPAHHAALPGGGVVKRSPAAIASIFVGISASTLGALMLSWKYLVRPAGGLLAFFGSWRRARGDL